MARATFFDGGGYAARAVAWVQSGGFAADTNPPYKLRATTMEHGEAQHRNAGKAAACRFGDALKEVCQKERSVGFVRGGDVGPKDCARERQLARVPHEAENRPSFAREVNRIEIESAIVIGERLARRTRLASG